jgi:hypothetical protein
MYQMRPEDGGNKSLRNVANHLQEYTTPQPRHEKPSSLGTLCAHLEVREGDDSKMHLAEVVCGRNWSRTVANNGLRVLLPQC